MSRREVLDVVRRRDKTCQAAGVNGWECWGPLDVHEVVPRSVWRDGQFEPANCRLICRRHHDWIDDNPAAAHALGLHGYSWERERTPTQEDP